MTEPNVTCDELRSELDVLRADNAALREAALCVEKDEDGSEIIYCVFCGEIPHKETCILSKPHPGADWLREKLQPTMELLRTKPSMNWEILDREAAHLQSLVEKGGGPAVGGRRIERSLADFERGCLVCLMREQEKLDSDNALIATLCDAVRLAREYADAMNDLGSGYHAKLACPDQSIS